MEIQIIKITIFQSPLHMTRTVLKEKNLKKKFFSILTKNEKKKIWCKKKFLSFTFLLFFPFVFLLFFHFCFFFRLSGNFFSFFRVFFANKFAISMLWSFFCIENWHFIFDFKIYFGGRVILILKFCFFGMKNRFYCILFYFLFYRAAQLNQIWESTN